MRRISITTLSVLAVAAVIMFLAPLPARETTLDWMCRQYSAAWSDVPAWLHDGDEWRRLSPEEERELLLIRRFKIALDNQVKRVYIPLDYAMPCQGPLSVDSFADGGGGICRIESRAEHRALLDAVKARDVDWACNGLTAHLQATQQVVLAAIAWRRKSAHERQGASGDD